MPNPGDSPSRQKLERLELPDMSGKAFLDIGRNEGFFCDAALRNGASRVVGMDNDPQVIEQARIRFPKVDFR
jgi:ribosomal protein L11 methylase PrmA